MEDVNKPVFKHGKSNLIVYVRLVADLIAGMRIHMLNADDDLRIYTLNKRTRSPLNQKSHITIHSGRDAVIAGTAVESGLVRYIVVHFISSFILTVRKEDLKVVFADLDEAKLEPAVELG
ncbi:Short-chain dehydrogenase/reductase [Ceratobasidium theobromae]|uniref:Short-chain dehydrogenase/reductase n=1 Tax=Ceratobasidium theobromae TaxID=1582974 RepID=A0A5N5QHP3_9AGAM|nr:Short-chain dehydrogenase/reductase [Ceratobasidium theobromae]